nr:hypothetical protein [Tanacetum cinerariifolium]
MEKPSSQNPSSIKITPKEEPDTHERPKSPNHFLPTDQVKFTFDEITLSTNNEVALLYPSYPNYEYFKIVSNFISKCCLKEAFTRAPNKYVEYLAEFCVHNWALKPNQLEGPPFTNHMKAIYNIDVPVESQAPTTSLKIEMKVPQGKKPRTGSRLKRKQSSKHISESKTETSKSKIGQLDKETQSSLAKDKILSHPSAPTPVVGEMYKEA